VTRRGLGLLTALAILVTPLVTCRCDARASHGVRPASACCCHHGSDQTPAGKKPSSKLPAPRRCCDHDRAATPGPRTPQIDASQAESVAATALAPADAAVGINAQVAERRATRLTLPPHERPPGAGPRAPPPALA